MNSVIIVSVTVAVSIVLAFLAAVALAKFRFTGRKLFIVGLIGIQMVPQVGLIIPLCVVLSRYQLTTNQYVLIGVIITYMTFALPFAVWTLRGFLLNVPKELEEAAKQTVTVWLSAFYGTSRQVDWGGLMAGSILTAIPVLVFFGFVQRKIAFGSTAGAVKG